MMSEYKPERIAGILLKTQPKYANTFIKQWELTGKPQVFCIYNRRPHLQVGDPVFCHAVGENRLIFVAKFVRSEWVRAFKPVESKETCLQERERIWTLYHNNQLHTDSKKEFDSFWEKWDGVRSIVIIEELKRIEKIVTWDDIRRRVLYTNFPHGVGYYYLSESDLKALIELTSINYGDFFT
jgi:hypothetical protein